MKTKVIETNFSHLYSNKLGFKCPFSKLVTFQIRLQSDPIHSRKVENRSDDKSFPQKRSRNHYRQKMDGPARACSLCSIHSKPELCKIPHLWRQVDNWRLQRIREGLRIQHSKSLTGAGEIQGTLQPWRGQHLRRIWESANPSKPSHLLAILCWKRDGRFTENR